MSHVVHSDREWTTSLGTSFYDRERELVELVGQVDRPGLLLILGPRNVGKSELLRYFISKELPKDYVSLIIDVRRIITGDLLQAIYYTPHDLLAQYIEDIANIVSELVRFPFPIGMVLRKIVETIRKFLKLKKHRILIIFDEFRLLYNNLSDVLNRIEALAKLVAFYPEYGDLKLVICDSEAWFTTGRAYSRLVGYATNILHIDHLDRDITKLLFEEYRTRKCLNIDFDTVYTIIGGAPGYLIELTSTNDIEKLVRKLASNLAIALSATAQELNINRELLVELNHKLFQYEKIDSLKEPMLYKLAEILAQYNITYIKISHAIETKPQIPLYKLLIEIMYVHRVSIEDAVNIALEMLRR